MSQESATETRSQSTTDSVAAMNSKPAEQQSTFSIATPTVTAILPITESFNDTSYLQPTASFHQDIVIELSEGGSQILPHGSDGHTDVRPPLDQVDTQEKLNATQQSVEEHHHQQQQQQQQNSSVIKGENETQPSHEATNSNVAKSQKKRNKMVKKNNKLDAKSKLEKSRQSARECRARKKLRYQYLEDLVCNREKAVVKLREELSMFCELSKQLDNGKISEKHRQILLEQKPLDT